MNQSNEAERTPIYELSICVRVAWQAHSLSTSGNNGSNKVMAHRQLLADGSETDACSGNIAKHTHAMAVAEYFEAQNSPLCPACQKRDSRRAQALLDDPEYGDLSLPRILQGCALCDSHGFLVTAKQGANGADARQRMNKETLIDFSYALALPTRSRETTQLHTRSGSSGTKEDGQMIMKFPLRSGEYALLVRYHCVGVGVDLEHWELLAWQPSFVIPNFPGRRSLPLPLPQKRGEREPRSRRSCWMSIYGLWYFCDGMMATNSSRGSHCEKPGCHTWEQDHSYTYQAPEAENKCKGQLSIALVAAVHYTHLSHR